MKKLLLLLCIIPFCHTAIAQYGPWQQYFDGADTSLTNSIIIKRDTATSNIWQIGGPHKVIFDSAATLPNALVTDTINYYPVKNNSRFYVTIKPINYYGILVLQWKQKIDFDKKQDGGIIEFSIDTGKTWQNAFNNPFVHSFYGFNLANKDTLVSGEYAFSGTDTNWKDIWLCYSNSFLSQYDSVYLRFTMKSDSVNNNKEGWMIDNMMARLTYQHTVKAMDQDQYLRVYPTPSTGIVYIEAQKINQFHIIKSMYLLDINGRVVEQYGVCPTKFWIDISRHPDGMYFLKIETNLKKETLPIILKR